MPCAAGTSSRTLSSARPAYPKLKTSVEASTPRKARFSCRISRSSVTRTVTSQRRAPPEAMEPASCQTQFNALCNSAWATGAGLGSCKVNSNGIGGISPGGRRAQAERTVSDGLRTLTPWRITASCAYRRASSPLPPQGASACKTAMPRATRKADARACVASSGHSFPISSFAASRYAYPPYACRAGGSPPWAPLASLDHSLSRTPTHRRASWGACGAATNNLLGMTETQETGRAGG